MVSNVFMLVWTQVFRARLTGGRHARFAVTHETLLVGGLVPSGGQPHFLFQIRSHRRTSFPSSEHLSLVSALPILLPLGSATVADTDTDTDRVPSHTSRRDRRDDISVSVSVSVPSHHVQPVFLELRGGRNKIGMAIHLHKAEYFYYT